MRRRRAVEIGAAFVCGVLLTAASLWARIGAGGISGEQVVHIPAPNIYLSAPCATVTPLRECWEFEIGLHHRLYEVSVPMVLSVAKCE